MDRSSPQDLVEKLAEKYGLRFVAKNKRYLGIYQGVCLDAWEYEKSVYLYFFSPTATITDEIAAQFQGFSHLGGTAVPAGWLQGRMLDNSQLDTCGCLLEMTPERRATISEQDVLDVPEAIVRDLHSHGGAAEPQLCSMCGEAGSTTAVYANDLYEFLCTECFNNLRDFAPDGLVQSDQPIRWKKVVITLAIWSAGFALIWGLLQQSERDMDGRLLLVAPFMGSIFFCRAVGKAALGMDISLRLLTAACILLSIVAGNIWGMRTAMLRHGDVTWLKTIELYFTWALTHAESNAWWFLLGGIAGSWVGFGMLKKQNVVEYK